MAIPANRVGIRRGLVVLLPALVLLVALAPAARSQDFHVRHYTIDDGLPSSQVQDIAQDGVGRMWFATRSGIASYDGTEWSIFNLTDGLDWTDTFALCWDEDGTLWSASTAAPSKISSLHGRRWRTFPTPDVFPADGRITSFAVLGGRGRGLVALGTDRGLLVADGDRWRLVKTAGALAPNAITALAPLDGRLVIGTPEGLAEYRRDGGISTGIAGGIPLREVTALAVEAAPLPDASRLWIVAREGIGYLEQGRFTRLSGGPTHPPLSPARRTVAVPDRRGGLYVGGPAALFHVRPGEGYRVIGRENGLLSEGVSALFLDREDNLWIGSRRGLSKISNRVFETYDLRHGLLEDEVTAVRERPDGTIVLAHPSGLSFLKRGPPPSPGGALPATEIRTLDLGRRLPELARRNDRIRDLAEDDRGNLWIPSHGVVELEPSGRLVWLGKDEGLPGAVHSVVASRGKLWAATDAGLFVFDGERFEPVPSPASRGPLEIRRLFAGSAGSLYVAASTGLYRLSEAGWHRWSCRQGGTCNSVFALHERSDGSLWAGTTAGLYRAEGDALVRETAPEIADPTYFILRDRRQRHWFGIDNGVKRWNGEELVQFTVRDGLAGRETNRAAGWVDSADRVWIGTERGVTVYTEDPRRPRRAPPVVVLGDLETEGRRLPLDVPQRLAFGKTAIFHFRAVSHVDEDRVEVSYRLEGSGEGWTPPQRIPRQELRYTNLPSGQYRLHVKAVSAEGLEGGVATSAEITVSRPFWQQPWFVLSVIVVLAAALYFVERLIAEKRYSRRLELMVDERVAQLSQVEAELAKSQKLEAIGLLAGGIAHDFNNFLTVLAGNVSLLALPGRSENDRADDLKDAQGAIVRASKLTQQLLTFSRGGAPVRKAASISEVIAESASFVLSGSKVKCEIDLPDDLRVVEIDAGQIHQLMNNLLINAMQAMPEGGTVQVVGRNVDRAPPGLEISPAEGREVPLVAIDVTDEGVGIPRENLERIFDPYFTTKEEGRGLGLASSYSIARRHDGLLTVTSEPEKGSTFTLYLPATEEEIPEAEDDGGEPGAGHGRILVMDDESSVRRVAGAILEGLGYEAVLAADGEAALDRYRQAMVEGRPFDAVLVDLTVPGGMGGKETVRRLAALDPQVRAIVVSGYSNDPVLADHHAYGFRGRLTKPFRRHDLAQVLRDVIDLREPAESPPPDPEPITRW